jgi:hypothetical protein
MKPLGIHEHRWEDNIKKDHKYGFRVWIGFMWLRIGTSGRLVYTVMILLVP